MDRRPSVLGVEVGNNRGVEREGFGRCAAV